MIVNIYTRFSLSSRPPSRLYHTDARAAIFLEFYPLAIVVPSLSVRSLTLSFLAEFRYVYPPPRLPATFVSPDGEFLSSAAGFLIGRYPCASASSWECGCLHRRALTPSFFSSHISRSSFRPCDSPVESRPIITDHAAVTVKPIDAVRLPITTNSNGSDRYSDDTDILAGNI